MYKKTTSLIMIQSLKSRADPHIILYANHNVKLPCIFTLYNS